MKDGSPKRKRVGMDEGSRDKNIRLNDGFRKKIAGVKRKWWK